MQARKLLLGTVVAALCLTAGVAVVVLLSGHFDETSDRILATTSAVSVFGLLALPAGTLLERSRAIVLGRVSAALTTVTFLLTLVVIWRDWSTGLGKAWGVLLTLSLASAQAAAVEARRRDDDTPVISTLVTGSMLTGSVLAALGIAAILTEIDDQSYYRVLGAVGVVDGLLIAVAAVLRRGTGPIARTYSIRVDGLLVEAPGRDFAGAVAAAIRRAEQDGATVRRIERT